MVADLQTSHKQEEDVIDLDAMTAEQLIQERAEVWSEIMRIEGQLADPSLIRAYGADEYVLWRGRAQRALRWRKIELRHVNDALNEKKQDELEARRQEKAAEKARNIEAARIAREQAQERKRLRSLAKTPRQRQMSNAALAAREAAIAKRRAVIEAMEGKGGLDGLLLRVWVAVNHLRNRDDDSWEWPPSWTTADTDAFSETHAYLCDLFGKKPVARAINGKLNEEGPE